MEVVELNVLNTAVADDFQIVDVIGVGQHGIVLAAKCMRPGLPDADKLYAVKLLFTFMHDFSSVVRNAYENEWGILSRILPQKNIVRYWAQFISVIPDQFIKHLPENVRSFAAQKDRSGEFVRRKCQFVVFDYHPNNLRVWLENKAVPLPFDLLFSLVRQLFEAVHHLQQSKVAHLDLKLDNILVSREGQLCLCDFGCAHQFSGNDFLMEYRHGNVVGGNKAHLAPEILTQYNKMKSDPYLQEEIDYSKQEAWAVGVLAYEIAMGRHPLVDYPLGNTSPGGVVTYKHKGIPLLPSNYPNAFRSIVHDLLHPDVRQRMCIKEGRKQLRLCFPESVERREIERLSGQLKAVRLERDIFEKKLDQATNERDEAITELKELRQEIRIVKMKHQKLEKECQLLEEEKQEAVGASEAAIDTQEMLSQQIDLLRREKNLALKQVEDLRKNGTISADIRECMRCKRFYIEKENGPTACVWHQGYLFNRWSCCYKKESEAVGCQATPHVDATTGQS